MAQDRIGRLMGRLAAAAITVCMAATAAQSQTAAPRPTMDQADTAGGFPTAGDIWRHLPGRATPQAPERTVPAGPAPAAPATAPAASPAPAAPARPAATAASPRNAAALRAQPARQTALSDARVVIHRSAWATARDAQALARRLRRSGAGEVEIRPVRLRLEKQSIRYFHAADRAVSETLGELVGRNGRGTVEDFTHYRPLPRRGTVEVWLP